MVNEEYAWENDVYVIGEQEKISISPTTELVSPCDYYKSADCDSRGGGTPSNNRTDGRTEYGGVFQATDLGTIESWFSGKLELRMVIVGTSGSAGTVIRDVYWGRISRSDFKDRK